MRLPPPHKLVRRMGPFVLLETVHKLRSRTCGPTYTRSSVTRMRPMENGATATRSSKNCPPRPRNKRGRGERKVLPHRLDEPLDTHCQHPPHTPTHKSDSPAGQTDRRAIFKMKSTVKIGIKQPVAACWRGRFNREYNAIFVFVSMRQSRLRSPLR